MDTKEKRPEGRPPRHRLSAGGEMPRRKNSVSEPRRRASAPEGKSVAREPRESRPKRNSSQRTQPSHRRTPAGASRRIEEVRRRRASARPQKNRVIKPPRQDVPEVVYTVPKPFRKGKFLLKLVSVVAVVLACMLVTSIFFRVDIVLVSGMEKYTPSSILEASGISEGDALLRVSKPRTSGKIIAKLPYVDQVKITRHLPGTVLIEVTELKVTYAIQAVDSTWWLITADGRVVEQIESSAAGGYTRILGLRLDAPRVGQQVETTRQTPPAQTQAPEETEESGLTVPTRPVITDAQKLATLLEILGALERNEVLGQIASIDLTDGENITMEYGQRFHVILGNPDRMDYKVSYMAQAVQSLEPDDRGELDVSFVFKEEAILTPDA